MRLILIYALCAAVGYFLGCHNLAHRLAQRRGFDIRTVGSNNPGASNTVIAIGSNCMGSGDDNLGATLMKGYIYAVSQQEELPKTILFYNGGAKLTTEGSLSLEDLKAIEEQGVQILTCGTCLNYYGLSEKLSVGSVTNMYTIVETLAQATKVIKP